MAFLPRIPGSLLRILVVLIVFSTPTAVMAISAPLQKEPNQHDEILFIHARSRNNKTLSTAVATPRSLSYSWVLVAHIGTSIQSTAAEGDSESFASYDSKLSDDGINALGFSIIMFEPVDSSYPTTYFNMDGISYASTTARNPCTPYALSESDALAGNWVVDTCCTYTVCNFGRGHCSGTVKSSMGFLAFGGCGGSGPVVGTSGVTEGAVKVYVYSSSPTLLPIPAPTSLPAPAPSALPAPAPSALPISAPSALPISAPTSLPAPAPSALPVPAPTSIPAPSPTELPAPQPSLLPVPAPSSIHPSEVPTLRPTTTKSPTPGPSLSPTPGPSLSPTTWLRKNKDWWAAVWPAAGGFGSCFHSSSTASVLVSAPGARYETKSTPLSRLKEGDRILALTANHKKMFAAVRKLPYSQSTEAFVEISVLEADSVVDEHLRASEHHTFPICGAKQVMAKDLKVGDCLYTTKGRGTVMSATRKEVKAGDVTYTVVVEGADFIAIGGVFAHAKKASAKALRASSKEDHNERPVPRSRRMQRRDQRLLREMQANKQKRQ